MEVHNDLSASKFYKFQRSCTMFRITRLTSGHRKPSDEKQQLIKFVVNDLKSADLKISLYVAACGGLPLNDVRPSPPVISAETNRIANASALVVNDSIPPPEGLLKHLKHEDGVISFKTYSVLKWLITGLKDPKITTVPNEEHSAVLSLAGSSSDANSLSETPVPEEIFSLKPHFMSTLGQDWRIKSCYMTTNYGFLPSKVEELHCLIYKGLVTTTLETDGSLVLHTNLNYCVNTTPATWTWGKSALGVNLKVVAMVEFVDNPLYVKSERMEIGHANLGCITLNNFKLLEPAYGRIRYLLIYPQEKRKPGLPLCQVHNGRNFIHFTIFLAWAVALSLACIIPKVNNTRNADFA